MLSKVAGPRVLIKQDKLEEIDPAFASAAQIGIQLPKEFKELRLEQNAVDKGTVVSIGENCWQPPVGNGTPWCKVGDRVIFAKYSGSILDAEERYIILNDEDILGVI